MTPSPAYKDSGIEWLGKIPEHWGTKKLKYCATIRSGQVDPKEDKYQNLLLIAPNHIESGSGRLLYTETADEQGAESGKYLFQAQDVLYSKIRPHLKKACLIDFEGLCSADMYPFTVKAFMLPQYLLFVILTDSFTTFATERSMRVAMPKINREDLGECGLPLPPIEEQQQIIAFLNHKTRLIDSYVVKKQQQIERLQAYRAALINQAVTKGLNPDAPMKDSGIEWLGKIPVGWEVVRLVLLLDKLQDGTHFSPPSDSSGDYLYITAKNIKEWGIDLSKITYVSEEDHTEIYKRCPVRQGDVLYIKDGATAGIATVNPLTEPFSMLSSVAMLRPKPERYDSRYLAYHLNTKAFKEYVLNGLIGGAMTRFTLEIISRFRLLAPPLPEQRAIAVFLDQQTAKIDNLITKTQRQIDRLSAYRTSLISDAVTGKIDVRNYTDSA